MKQKQKQKFASPLNNQYKQISEGDLFIKAITFIKNTQWMYEINDSSNDSLIKDSNNSSEFNNISCDVYSNYLFEDINENSLLINNMINRKNNNNNQRKFNHEELSIYNHIR